MPQPNMRYEIIEEKFDEDGRFCGLVEAMTEDGTWSSGPSRVNIGAEIDVTEKDALGADVVVKRFNGKNPTDAHIRKALKQWAKDHAPHAKKDADEKAAKAAGPPAPRFTPGVYDADSGTKVAEPTERDPETKKKKVALSEASPGVADLPVK